MRQIPQSTQHAAVPTARLRAALLLVGLMSGLSMSVCAAERPDLAKSTESSETDSRSRALERDFWTCDHAAATRGIVGAEAQMCGSNFEELKNTRFGGDFQAMVEWWHRNKAVEYQALVAQVSKP